jgi:hypothetical protein
MRFWSRGLGERELVIDMSRGNLENEKDNTVVMRGVITEPVKWNYEITLFDIDVRGILRIIFTPQALMFFAKNIGGLGMFFARLFKRDYGDREYLKKTAEEKEKAAAKAKAAEAAKITS